MAITADQLKRLVEAEGLRYFLLPDRPGVMLAFSGPNGRRELIADIDLDGRFLQFRSLDFAVCPVEHHHLLSVLAALGALNYQFRLSKLAWDPSDGEIVVYADFWLEDVEMSQQQFSAVLKAYLSTTDVAHERIAATLATGMDPEGALARGASGHASDVPRHPDTI